MNYYRVYMNGLYVGIGVRAERMEIDETNVFFWNDAGRLVASFWLADVERIQELPLATPATPATADVIGALRASL